MMIREQTWEEKYFSKKFRESLDSFSLFSEDHQIRASQNGSVVTLRYATHPILEIPQTKAILNVHIDERKGDIIYLAIDPAIRRRGVGRELYGQIEGFFKKVNCNLITLCASGIGEKFWPEMGYRPISPENSKLIKYLTS